jgi:hypothetical protein
MTDLAVGPSPSFAGEMPVEKNLAGFTNDNAVKTDNDINFV